MSKKHHQRTRAEILAKRREEDALRLFARAKGFHKHVSKYTPHIGAKEQERATRCYMSPTFNYSGNLRAAPVMHQISKPSNKVHVYAIEQEYESVF